MTAKLSLVVSLGATGDCQENNGALYNSWLASIQSNACFVGDMAACGDAVHWASESAKRWASVTVSEANTCVMREEAELAASWAKSACMFYWYAW